MKKTGAQMNALGDANFIQKKVPVSKKYENVKSALIGKIGATAKDVETVSKFIILILFITGDNLLAKRKNEKYKRIKCSTLAKLMQENNHEESIYNLNENGSMGGD